MGVSHSRVAPHGSPASSASSADTAVVAPPLAYPPAVPDRVVIKRIIVPSSGDPDLWQRPASYCMGIKRLPSSCVSPLCVNTTCANPTLLWDLIMTLMRCLQVEFVGPVGGVNGTMSGAFFKGASFCKFDIRLYSVDVPRLAQDPTPEVAIPDVVLVVELAKRRASTDALRDLHKQLVSLMSPLESAEGEAVAIQPLLSTSRPLFTRDAESQGAALAALTAGLIRRLTQPGSALRIEVAQRVCGIVLESTEAVPTALFSPALLDAITNALIEPDTTTDTTVPTLLSTALLALVDKYPMLQPAVSAALACAWLPLLDKLRSNTWRWSVPDDRFLIHNVALLLIKFAVAQEHPEHAAEIQAAAAHVVSTLPRTAPLVSTLTTDTRGLYMSLSSM